MADNRSKPPSADEASPAATPAAPKSADQDRSATGEAPPGGREPGKAKPDTGGATSTSPAAKPRETQAARSPAEAASGAPTPASKPARGAGAAALAVAVLALLLTIGLALGGGYLWWMQQQLALQVQEQDRRLSADAERLGADLTGRLERQEAQLAQLAERQQAQLEEAAERQRELTAAMDEMRTLAGRGRNDWVLAEVEYLLRIANRRLQLQQDPGTAMAALEFADRRLRELADPGLQPVRTLIAREVARLDATPLPDLDGLAARLASLSEQVDDLAVRAARPPERTPPSAAAGNGSPVEDWRAALDRAGEALQRLVVVRRHDQPVEPLLGAQEEFAAREGLRLQLEAARLALLGEDPELYRSSLAAAGDWLTRYFVAEDATYRSMADTLGQLAEASVRTELPDISDSLRELREIMARRDAGEAAGAQAPAADAPVQPRPADNSPAAPPAGGASADEPPPAASSGGGGSPP